MPSRRVLIGGGVLLAVVLAGGAVAAWILTAPRWPIAGRVIQADGSALPGVRVQLSSGASGTTNADGRFSLTAPLPGVWVTVTADGWLARTRAAQSGDEVLIRLSPDDGRTVRLLFGGDVMFGRRYYDANEDGDRSDGLLRTGATPGDHRRLLDGVAPLIADADLTIVNLESPLIADPWFDPREARPDRFHPTKEFAFASAPESARALHDAGIDVIGLGNNHAYDALEEGLRSTHEALTRAGFTESGLTGAGANATEAWRPAIQEVRGQRIAFLACTTITGEEHEVTYVADAAKGGAAYCEPESLRAAVAAARRQSDLVVAMIHGGFEYVREPSDRIEALTRAAHDAGATLVVNHHSHVTGGLEWTNDGALTAWTMGNLLFDQTVWPTFSSYVLRVDVRDGHAVNAYVEPIMLRDYLPLGVVGERADWVARDALALSSGPWVVDDGSLSLAPHSESAEVAPAADAPATDGDEILALDGACLDGATLDGRGRDLLWTGDFEDNEVDSDTEGGALWTLSGQNPDRELLPEAASSGGLGVRMERRGGHEEDLILTPLHRLLVTPGQELTTLLDVRGTNQPEAALQLSWYNDTRGESQAQTTVELPVSEAWQPLRLDVTVPEHAVAVGLFVRLAPPGGAGTTLDVDNVRLIAWAVAGVGPACDYVRYTDPPGAGELSLVDRRLPAALDAPHPRWLAAGTLSGDVPAALPPGPEDSPWQGME